MYRKFPYLDETDFSLPKLVQQSRVSLRNTLRGNQKSERFRPNKQRLFSISTNEKRKIQAKQKILKRKRPQLTRFAQTILSQTIAVSGNDPAASGEPRCAWFWVGMIPKKGVGTSVPHPS